MPTTSLTLDEWSAQLHDYRHTARRLELQPAYAEPGEAEHVDRYHAGEPILPDDDPEWVAWLDQVARQAADGRRMARVRVHDDPPTRYQQWLRWSGRWNERAGEDIRYMTRQRARDVGLPADSRQDWWLFDDERLVVMMFDDEGRRIGDVLTTDPEAVEQARAWWGLAVHHSAPDTSGVPLP